MKRLIIWSIIGTGIGSVITQLLTIREFLTQFHGNELTISLVLFSWLLLAGLGSLSAAAFRKASLLLYGLLLAITALWPIIQIVGIRAAREYFFIHGSSPGFYQVFVYIVAGVSLYCLLTGFLLPYALRLLKENGYSFNSGHLYLVDNVGDVLGGVLFSFILVYWFKPFATIALSSCLLLFTGLALLLRLKCYRISGVLCLVSAGFFLFCLSGSMEIRTLGWHYGKIVRYKESPYGRIVLTKEDAQRTVWQSGTPLYTKGEMIESEEKIHYPLCQLQRTDKILLISGGLGRTVGEVAKYSPGAVDYVEPDPALTEEALALGPGEKPPFLRIINRDGRAYIRSCTRLYDAIILDVSNPDTFQLNRFYTAEFFSAAKRVLKKGGILSLGIEYSRNYIGDIRARKLSSLYNTARRSFENVIVIPGGKAFFLCREGELSLDIPERLAARRIHTEYIAGSYHGDITTERIAALRKALLENEPVNRDFEPRLMNLVFKEWFSKHGGSYFYIVFGLSAVALVCLVFMGREQYVLFSTGFSTMGAEMVVVLAFQIVFGYVYREIGAIITVFLMGLLPGALLGNMERSKTKNKLVVSEISMVLMLIVAYAYVECSDIAPHKILFFSYGFLFALICGFQFPVAAGIMGESRDPAAGLIAADLWGAAIGTMVVGTIAIPLWGLDAAVGLLLFVKLLSGIAVVSGVGRRRSAESSVG